MKTIITTASRFAYRQEKSDIFRPAIETFGFTRTYNILTSVLSFLCRQHRMKHERPMTIRSKDAEQTLSDFLDLCPELADLFEVSKKRLNFRESIPPQKRAEMRKEAIDTNESVTMT